MNNITTFKICVICVPFVVISEKMFMRLPCAPARSCLLSGKPKNEPRAWFLIYKSGHKNGS